MPGLWRNNPETAGGKYLVQRRDGSTPEWPYIVLGAKDPAAADALDAYAAHGERYGYDPQYIDDIRRLAREFRAYCAAHGPGNPTDGPERADDPEVVAKMVPGRSA